MVFLGTGVLDTRTIRPAKVPLTRQPLELAVNTQVLAGRDTIQSLEHSRALRSRSEFTACPLVHALLLRHSRTRRITRVVTACPGTGCVAATIHEPSLVAPESTVSILLEPASTGVTRSPRRGHKTNVRSRLMQSLGPLLLSQREDQNPACKPISVFLFLFLAPVLVYGAVCSNDAWQQIKILPFKEPADANRLQVPTHLLHHVPLGHSNSPLSRKPAPSRRRPVACMSVHSR
jgi:hypothetical protein